MHYAPIPMVPGPVSLHPDVIDALNHDYGSGLIEPDYMALYEATTRNLAALMNTRSDVVLMTGEGMLALWGALKSCLKPGDGVVCVGTGVFGDGTADMARSFGCRVESVSLPYDRTICDDDLNVIADAIRKIRPVMITAVHCETPSGTLNPLKALGQLKQDLGVPLFYVDAVASLGGTPVYADDWHVDLLLGGAQKCLSAPPSMCMVGVSDAAWERVDAVQYQGYDALGQFRHIRTEGAPYTPYWHGLAALHVATQALFREGLDNVFARHERVAARCRAGLAELGVKLWTAPQAVNSPTVTAARIPEGLTEEVWQARLRAQGLICCGSYGPMKGKVFRLGHMGVQAQDYLMGQALRAVAAAL
ncbi:MAG TPA: alanine--glyoxylate aminotransferase family protein [Candidatus Avidesulfovibrio excrementigallinarum]|nr:alanine--glyoxylate aminotransferase family protein [Candidatus Avidesulfovibrio excrementigallinarum]